MTMLLKKKPVETLLKSFKYAEINRLREKIVNMLQEQNQKTLMVTGPHDGAGNTLLASLLSYNLAYFTSMRILLVDINMRNPQIHLPFGLKLKTGFSEIASGSLIWKRAAKNTSLSGLKIITAGQPNMELSTFLKRSLYKDLINEMKEYFDLILFDTSPLLSQNRNNVDPAILSQFCDMVIIVAQYKKTKKSELKNAVSAITNEGGKVTGIVYNQNY